MQGVQQGPLHIEYYTNTYKSCIFDYLTDCGDTPVQPKNTHTLAASAATKADLEEAKRRAADGKVKPVQPERRMWRPKMASQYEEPDCIPDAMGDLEILYKDFGKPLWIKKTPLPPRDDIITFDPIKHKEEFTRNMQWADCPEEMRPRIESIILQFWDVFIEEGVRNPIRGALFHVDTGQTQPICARPPRYGPHETRVINELVEKLEKNGIIEDDDGPWGAPIVLAAKANQEHLHWSQYTWRLCVSYRKLNAVTRPFTFPIIRCDDAVKEIGNSKYFITMDLDSGYWQVPCEEKSRAKLAFFTPTGKKRWTTMPMGATNAHPVFVALVAKFKEAWDSKAASRGLKDFQSQVIVDDIMISAREVETLLEYLKCVLEVLQHHRCTAKLKKCRFLPSIAEFVGLDIHPEGNSPAKSKFEAFDKLGKPTTFTDLNMLIGCFGFYQEHLPLYEVRIKRWRELQKLRPLPGTPRSKDKEILDEEWKKEDEELLAELKQAITSEPILRRPNSNARFYLKTDWSKNAMGAALLQPNPDDDAAMLAMKDEIAGEACQFDQTKSGLRLHPIAFISRRTAGPEQSYHSYVGEACAGIWAIEKFRPYLFGREFTWLTDCSGLRKFFEGDEVPTHMVQRWRMQLLRYDFTIAHRPGRMMFECDMLSRYNLETDAWRQQENSADTPAVEARTLLTVMQPPPIPWTHNRIQFTKGKRRQTTMALAGIHKRRKPNEGTWAINESSQMEALMEHCDSAKDVWIVGARMTVIPEALEALGIDMNIATAIEDDPQWQSHLRGVDMETAIEMAMEAEYSPDWLIITNKWDDKEGIESSKTIIEHLAWKGLKSVVICHETTEAPHSKFVHAEWCKWLGKVLLHRQWGMTACKVKADQVGSVIEQEHMVYFIGNNSILDYIRELPNSENSLHTPSGTVATKAIREFIDHQHRGNTLILTDQSRANVDFPAGSRSRQVFRAQLGDQRWWPVFAEDGLCPNPADSASLGPRGTPLIYLTHHNNTPATRHIVWKELAAMLGMEKQNILGFEAEKWREQDLIQELTKQPPIETWMHIFAILTKAEALASRAKNRQLSPYQGEHLQTLTQMTSPSPTTSTFQTMIDRWTTIPLPTHKQWADTTEHDHDLSLVLVALCSNQNLERHRLSNKKYFEAWDKGHLEAEDGIIYHLCEPRFTQIRQLRRRVVPPAIRQIVITAYHATPLAGHSDNYRTYWRIAARYWWPRMYLDVKEAIATCAHCRLANATGHEAQQVLTSISSDTPFDVIALDVWSPGDVMDKHGNVKGLTSLDTMTGFASVAVIKDTSSETVARTVFASFFVPNGLPKLILLDAGSENKGMLIDMCRILRVKHHAVAPENHNGVLCERFHRYLNKVQKIGAANTQSFTQWAQGIAFAAYSWNAAPIDGTNIVRSFVAKGRDFPFPLQIAEDNNPPRIPPGQGEAAISHVETMFPLWAQQSTMLQILVAERRERPREMINQSKSQRVFNPGDLVIIRKQVQSDSALGRPAKQTFKWKGIYRVLRKEGEKSYLVQKQPTLQNRSKAGKIIKYSAAVMEKIPSSLVVHKHLDTTDTRLSAMEHPLVKNPLEQNLGFHKFGKYVRATEGASEAFDKVEDLWAIEIDSDDEEDEDKGQLTNLATLYEAVKASKDKICIIQMRIQPRPKHDWFVVQVDWENTCEDKARNEGIYHLRWMTAHHGDIGKRTRCNCRYWPEIHEIEEDGALGRMRAVSPGKISTDYLAKQNWAYYAYDMNLATDILVGPFEFARLNKEPNRIDKSIWEELLKKEGTEHVDLSSIHRIVPKL